MLPIKPEDLGNGTASPLFPMPFQPDARIFAQLTDLGPNPRIEPEPLPKGTALVIDGAEPTSRDKYSAQLTFVRAGKLREILHISADTDPGNLVHWGRIRDLSSDAPVVLMWC